MPRLQCGARLNLALGDRLGDRIKASPRFDFLSHDPGQVASGASQCRLGLTLFLVGDPEGLMVDGRKLPGYVMYNEYQEGSHPDISDLVQDYPADFFADVARLEAGIVVPSLALQRRLLDTITSPIYARLHDPHYSVIANPYTVGRQNCTKFVLDVITAAIYQTGDLAVIKANERAFFVAQPVNIVPLKLFFGALFNPELSLSDQPGKPVTATFERIADFLMAYDRGAERFAVVP